MNAPLPAPGTKRIRPGRRLSLRQVLDLQQITHEAALGLREDFASSADREERARVASSLANLGKAFVSLQDAKREILGRPKAGVLKPEGPKKSKPSLRSFPLDDYELVPAESPVKSVQEKQEQRVESEGNGLKVAAAPAAAAATTALGAECPLCHGEKVIKVSGGDMMACGRCAGTGRVSVGSELPR